MASLHNPLADVTNALTASMTPAQAMAVKVLMVALPMAAVAGGAALIWMRQRRVPAAVAPGGAAGVAQVEPGQLRGAWKRFERGLPADVRRALLNYEHYLVIGPAGSGKTRLIDTYSDWRRQSKEQPGSQPGDPDLPVYLGSGTVVTELPARFLFDHSRACQEALARLWKPLYRHRAPTVVVAVDVRQLRDSTAEALRELGETVRAKVNWLTRVRGHAVEVRLALTHLDAQLGYPDMAAFAREMNLPLWTPLDVSPGAAPVAAQIDVWLEQLHGHLPRALTSLEGEAYLRLVSWMRATPSLLTPLGALPTSLFSPATATAQPTAGGVFWSSEPAGVANPLTRAAERGASVDPRRWHMVAAVAVASVTMALLISAYRLQRDLYTPAAAALNGYDASTVGSDSERLRRRRITDFAYRQVSWTETTPNYFGTARAELRRRFSTRVREDLLVPQLKRLATDGTTVDSPLALPTRRSLYLLAVIHSDRADRMNILGPGRLEIWSAMTGLPQDLIRDYLLSTDEAWKLPVTFDLIATDSDRTTAWQVWTNFLRAVSDVNERGAVSPDELRRLQSEAIRLEKSLERFDHDDLTVRLLYELDGAAGTGGGATPPLRQAYEGKYADYIRSASDYRVLDQRERLRTVMRTVRLGAVDAQGPALLRGLVERLGALYEGSSGTATDDEPVKVTLAGQDFVFDPRRWRTVLRDSTGRETIGQFLRAAAVAPSIFFGPEQDAELHPVVWNPTNDGSAIFTGRAVLEGRYTKAAYDNHVRAVILKLGEALDHAATPRDQRQQLEQFVSDRVRRYASDYRGQLVNFVQGFGLRVTSPEALRVALAQMVKPDPSGFNDFLDIPDTHSRLELGHPLLEPMRTVTDEFAAWRGVVKGEGGAAEIVKYRAILGQLLTDLSPAEGGDASGPETLERMLTPTGRLVLAELRGEKGSYGPLVNEWLLSVRLPDYQRAPFASVTAELHRLGRRDIERSIAVAWDRELVPSLRRLASRFPFDLTASEEVSPAELTEMLHPQSGRLFDVFRRYFEPLSDFGQGGAFRPRAGLRGRLAMPAGLYEVTNAAAAISARLWDSAGKPTPLVVRVATVPFEHGANPRLALTLVYLNVGSASLFNFNQKPAQIAIPVDWTRDTSCQVGLQLTDPETRGNVYVEPIRADNSPWSWLRLLQKGQAAPVRAPVGAQLYTWTFPIAREQLDSLPGQFVVLDDLAGLFALGPYVRSRLGGAAAGPGGPTAAVAPAPGAAR